VSACLCAVAVGTETSGSILSPAQQNSVVGIKPTVGLVSRSGIIPIMVSQDTAGPLARTVTDAAILLGVLAGIDDSDPVTMASDGRTSSDYTRYLDAGALRGARLGVPREVWAKAPDEARPVLEEALSALREAGASIIDPAPMPEANELMSSAPAMTYEFKPALNAYLKGLSSHVPVHSLKELIEYNYRDPARMLRYGQALLLRAEATSGRLVEPEYVEARALDLRLSREQGIDRLIAEHHLDAVLMPGSTGAGIAARAGYPAVCVPAGYSVTGQPVGITFTAGAYTEGTLIALAYSYEQATRVRKPPALAR
jgi:amidase